MILKYQILNSNFLDQKFNFFWYQKLIFFKIKILILEFFLISRIGISDFQKPFSYISEYKCVDEIFQKFYKYGTLELNYQVNDKVWLFIFGGDIILILPYFGKFINGSFLGLCFHTFLKTCKHAIKEMCF